MRLALSSLSLIAVVVVPATARAQSAPARSPDAQGDEICLGFSFGAWKPVLDWRAAGHGEPPSAKTLQHAPGGRDWAADTPGARDSTLLLFPAWWPAGVLVTFPRRPLVIGDTVRGEALALVADGRMDPPKTTVLTRRVPCHG